MQDFIVFENDTREKDICFKPTDRQIEKAEKSLFEYLDNLTKNNQTIFVNSLDKMIPLQEHLKYYKRRYFGRTNIEGQKVIKIEFVFVRCGGQDEWKKIDYTNETTKACWISIQYNIDNDNIYNLIL